MSSSQVFSVEGVVLENLPNTMFRIKITAANNSELLEKTILAHLAGKMRVHFVRLLPGDRVRCEINALDLTKGRVVSKQR